MPSKYSSIPSHLVHCYSRWHDETLVIPVNHDYHSNTSSRQTPAVLVSEPGGGWDHVSRWDNVS